MSSDIRLSIDFRDHPKVVKLHKLLGEAGISSLVTLWAWTRKYRSKGTFTGMDALDIEIGARWPGGNGLFVKALVDLILLDFDGEVYSVHDWKEHQPWAYFADERSAQSRKAAERRWAARTKAKETECAPHKDSMRTALKTDADRNADSQILDAPSPSPLPLPSPKEERSKECPAADAAGPPPSGRTGKGNGSDPTSPKPRTRRKKEYPPEVLELWQYYCDRIVKRPDKKADTLQNIMARINEGVTVQKLGIAIENYFDVMPKDPSIRYHPNNFFGQKAYFEGFLPEPEDGEVQADD